MKKNEINKFINVAIPIKLNSTYLYKIPKDINISDVLYRRLLVNFNGKEITGYAISEGKYTDKYKIKEFTKIVDQRPVLKKTQIEFANWISNYYFCGIGEALSLMVPRGKKPANLSIEENISDFKPEVNNLTKHQKIVFNNIKKDINNDIKKFYLYGVTGSGKTEIYIKLIEEVINLGKSIIYLVPEITLSYQTLERLKKRFGNLCAILHSNLKGSVRLREYFNLFDNKAKIAIGPRSALFAPVNNIGLIIIDEENENAYKSEESPRFHARTAAFQLASINKALIILGSATPSIESWYFTKKNFLKLYSLKERFGGALLPDINIIDTSNIKTKKNLSMPLIEEINKRITNNEQIVLLQNRRGFANFIKCKSCNELLNCPKCEISLTYHKSKNKCICHHCGYNIELPQECPSCHDENLIKIGAGTERIEDEISKIFQHAIIKRMDYDTLKNEKDMKKLFNEISDGKINILVGTQMIAKGLHFPKIKFVGIINADIILNIPDFKASERAFSLITQVSGRAGRIGEKGEVMIQTMNPDHYSIIAAKNTDFEEFYSKEIEFRKILKMPPFVRLIRLIIRGKDEQKIIADIKKLYNEIQKISNKKEIDILGPSPCLFSKINNNFRYQILLKSNKMSTLQNLLKHSLNNFTLNNKNYLEIDVDPVALV